MCIFTALVSALVYYYLYLNYDERISCRIGKDIVVINDLFSSMYLVKAGDGYIAIDAGFDGDIIKKGLQYSGIDAGKVFAVLLTHTDADHQNAIAIFNRAKTYLSADEYKMIKEKRRRFSFLSFYYNSLKTGYYELKKDNDVFRLGGREVRCISLPGHTPGSMGFLIDSTYLFSGDAFRIKNGKISIPFKKFFAMDIEQARKSIKKISSYKFAKYLFPSHSSFTADVESALP